MPPMKHRNEQPENPFVKLVSNQKIAIIPQFTLESGVTLCDVPVAYKTWGSLNEERNNCMIICHAFTGSADVEDWWGPLFGPGKAFDTSRFFIFCGNSLGSPYGSASACTSNPETDTYYGPEFPLVTVRDDVNIHKIIIDQLEVEQIAIVIGGSMGGMLVLEWAYFGRFVKTIVPIATSAQSSAWCISWGEAQRQSIYCDPKYQDGYYPFEDPPTTGLGAARMSALLTYRSRNSFETRFGRNTPDPLRHPYPDQVPEPTTPNDENWVVHNEGHRSRLPCRPPHSSTTSSPPSRTTSTDNLPSYQNRKGSFPARKVPTYFTAQSYLRYQADKFIQRFDANCYISITRKLDTHDVARGRYRTIHEALSQLKQPALVLGIESDGLFTFGEQEEIASCMPNATLDRIISPEGHDGFLLEFEQMNGKLLSFLHRELPEIMSKRVEPIANGSTSLEAKPNTFGEVDDITTW